MLKKLFSNPHIGEKKVGVKFKILIRELNFDKNDYFMKNASYSVFQEKNHQHKIRSKKGLFVVSDTKNIPIDETLKFHATLFESHGKYSKKTRRIIVRQNCQINGDDVYKDVGYVDLPLDEMVSGADLDCTLALTDPDKHMTGHIKISVKFKFKTDTEKEEDITPVPGRTLQRGGYQSSYNWDDGQDDGYDNGGRQSAAAVSEFNNNGGDIDNTSVYSGNSRSHQLPPTRKQSGLSRNSRGSSSESGYNWQVEAELQELALTQGLGVIPEEPPSMMPVQPIYGRTASRYSNSVTDDYAGGGAVAGGDDYSVYSGSQYSGAPSYSAAPQVSYQQQQAYSGGRYDRVSASGGRSAYSGAHSHSMYDDGYSDPPYAAPVAGAMPSSRPLSAYEQQLYLAQQYEQQQQLQQQQQQQRPVPNAYYDPPAPVPAPLYDIPYNNGDSQRRYSNQQPHYPPHEQPDMYDDDYIPDEQLFHSGAVRAVDNNRGGGEQYYTTHTTRETQQRAFTAPRQVPYTAQPAPYQEPLQTAVTSYPHGCTAGSGNGGSGDNGQFYASNNNALRKSGSSGSIKSVRFDDGGPNDGRYPGAEGGPGRAALEEEDNFGVSYFEDQPQTQRGDYY